MSEIPDSIRIIHVIQWWQFRKRSHCPHQWTVDIYGDLINAVGGWRNRCVVCGKYLDGPVSISDDRNWIAATTPKEPNS